MSEFDAVYYFSSPMNKPAPDFEAFGAIPVPAGGFTISIPHPVRYDRWYNVWFRLPSGHVEGRAFLGVTEDSVKEHVHALAAKHGLEVVKIEPTHAYQGVYETEDFTHANT